MALLTRPPDTTTHEGEQETERSPWRPFALAVLTLLISALLNAEEIERTARRESLGWRRTVLVEAAASVRAVADATLLTEPREALERLVEREGDSRPAVAATAQASTENVRVVLVGDSVMQVIGESFTRLAFATGGIDVTVESHLATGLSRADYFDWPRRLQELAAERPDAVVVLFGAQDAQRMQGAEGILRVGTPEWDAEYRRRVGNAMDILVGTNVVWLGQPAMRSDALSLQMARLNAIYRAEAASRGITYVDTWALTDAPDGTFASRLDNAEGEPVVVRDDDGVHFVRAGGDLVARAILDAIRDR